MAGAKKIIMDRISESIIANILEIIIAWFFRKCSCQSWETIIASVFGENIAVIPFDFIFVQSKYTKIHDLGILLKMAPVVEMM